MIRAVVALAALFGIAVPAPAQTPPGAADVAAYTGLHAAAQSGDAAAVGRLLAGGQNPDPRDGHGCTPLHLAAHRGDQALARVLVAGKADPRAKDSRNYDIITIAAVRDDAAFVRLAIELGADPRAITSPYDGTALIAAAHLGHHDVIDVLIKAGSPLDHVNNLGWTALIEAIVLGDGGPRHLSCVRLLLAAGADPNRPDRHGATPLALARARGFGDMASAVEAAGGR